MSGTAEHTIISLTTPVSSAPAMARRSLHTRLLALSQWLTWPIAYAYFHAFYDLTIEGTEHLHRVERPFIIISNHVNAADSFLFRLILGFRTAHLPLRFMAVRKFSWGWLNILADIGVIPFIYSLFGVFTVVPGRGLAANLREPKDLIRKGESVVIYPEGRINVTGTLYPFKAGAGTLASETGCPVVPVSFRIATRAGKRRPSFRATVGEPIVGTRALAPEQATRAFYIALARLHSKNKAG